jgi:hypothetical protein
MLISKLREPHSRPKQTVFLAEIRNEIGSEGMNPRWLASLTRSDVYFQLSKGTPNQEQEIEYAS